MKLEPTIEIILHEGDVPVRGNAIASDDEAYDKEVEDEILARLEYDLWAWCCVEVRATIEIPEQGIKVSGSDYLGGCSYKNEADFRSGGYFEDMVEEAVRALADEIELRKQQAEFLGEVELQLPRKETACR